MVQSPDSAELCFPFDSPLEGAEIAHLWSPEKDLDLIWRNLPTDEPGVATTADRTIQALPGHLLMLG